MADDGVRRTITGLSRSADPAKMSAAFSILDAEYNRDPQAFDRNYGSDTETNLFMWQEKRAYQTPEQMIAEIRRADDPAEKARRKHLREEAGEATRKWTDADAMKRMGGGGWFFGPSKPSDVRQLGLLRAEYTSAYTAAFAETGDDAVAHRKARSQLERTWGQSEANGGELMRRPPEKFYPAVGGNHDYIKEQLDQEVRTAIIGRLDSYAVGGGPGSSEKFDTSKAVVDRLKQSDKKIVADERTEKEIAAGQPPSYSVVVRYSDGLLDLLHGTDGRALRFTPDPSAETSTIVATAQHKHKTALVQADLINREKFFNY